MNEITCPLCGKPNPPDREVCQFCEAPLKTTGFIASPEDQDIFDQLPPQSDQAGEPSAQAAQPGSASSLEQAIPDWLKQTEANFTKPSESEPGELTHDRVSEEIDSLLNLPFTPAEAEKPVIDDEWLASLLAEAGVGEPVHGLTLEEPLKRPPEVPSEKLAGAEEAGELEQIITGPIEEETQPIAQLEPDKPEWLTNLEASSTIKLEGGMQPSEPSEPGHPGATEAGQEAVEAKTPEQTEVPTWVGKTSFGEAPPILNEPETPIVPAEIPGWLEALRPTVDKAAPTGPVEDNSTADIVTAGPLVGLRGVISAHPSAIQARKPPTYSIKLRVTDEQRARVEMMEELLAEEQKPNPPPSKPIVTYRYLLRLLVAALLILPILWMVIYRSEQSPLPQPGDIPGVVDFTQQVQKLATGVPVLLAFDYEPGFSGEMNVAISTLLTQLFSKNVYLTLVTTNPSGPALAESLMRDVNASVRAGSAAYLNYTDLGYLPGGTMGLLGFAASPQSVMPYSLDGNNVWENTPLNAISSIADFNAVIVITNDPDTARSWIEQVGPQLRALDKPLLIVASSQAEPLIRPYYAAIPAQVQGVVAGLAGGLAYGQTVGGQSQSGLWDALSIGVTVSILIILIGGIISLVSKTLIVNKKKEE